MTTVLHNPREFLFVEKYRPQTLDDCILPERILKPFREMVKKGEIINTLLVGSGGVGKTTVAKALCKELGCDYIVINCSENGNIDTLRTTIREFASTVSLDGGIKVVIMDEADGLPSSSTQQALRNFIEEFSVNCRFIFTANFKNKIIEPLHSRLLEFDFTLTKEEKPAILMAWVKRLTQIMQQEGIQYDPELLTKVAVHFFLDFRKTLNNIQRYSQSGTLEIGALGMASSEMVDVIYEMLKGKKFSDMRKWVAENPDTDINVLGRSLYNHIDQYVQPASIPQFILHFNDYQHKNSMVVNKEINLMAFLTELMADLQYI